MAQAPRLKYTGRKLSTTEIDAGHTPYLAEPGLVESVNLAIALERPLILAGSLGCGKSGLARAVARELKLDYYVWHIKSTSTVREGLYRFDAIARLRDAHLTPNIEEGIPGDDKYIRYGPLGQAFLSPEPVVVMIHEIDNGDIDFPNDLLIEFDERRFFITELNRWVRARSTPIVVVTSSMAKALPEAFLRRCIYYYLDFPNPERLISILEALYPDVDPEEIEMQLFGSGAPASHA